MVRRSETACRYARLYRRFAEQCRGVPSGNRRGFCMRLSPDTLGFRVVLAGIVVFMAGGPAWAADPVGKTKKVLFIGIDGCRFDAIQAARAPHLDRLMAEGCYDADCQILGERFTGNDTVSGPGWSSILTGVWADKHGVLNNDFKVKHYEEYPHFFARLKEVQPTRTRLVRQLDSDSATYCGRADVRQALSAGGQGLHQGRILAAKAAAKVLSEADPAVLLFTLARSTRPGTRTAFIPRCPIYPGDRKRRQVRRASCDAMRAPQDIRQGRLARTGHRRSWRQRDQSWRRTQRARDPQ